jgi:hypothetical protein
MSEKRGLSEDNTVEFNKRPRFNAGYIESRYVAELHNCNQTNIAPHSNLTQHFPRKVLHISNITPEKLHKELNTLGQFGSIVASALI